MMMSVVFTCYFYDIFLFLSAALCQTFTALAFLAGVYKVRVHCVDLTGTWAQTS
jgi:hypothetical protein